MSELARNKRTGIWCVAAELPYAPELLQDQWECPLCGVAMIPVAADGAREYKVSPYFRALDPHGSHATEVAPTEHESLTGNQQRRLPVDPRLFPKTMRLSSLQPRRERENLFVRETIEGSLKFEGPGAFKESREYIAGSIHRIAQCYVDFPEERDRPLNIKGLNGGSYSSCFHKLKNTKTHHKFGSYIFFCEISFRRLRINNETVELGLSPVLWDVDQTVNPPRYRRAENYRIIFHTQVWGPRREKAFYSELEMQIKQQMRMHNAQDANSINAFFIGSQDEGNPMIFHVSDPRLICFIPMKKT